MKFCKTCNVEKSLEDFGKCKGTKGGYKDGRKYICKSCENLKNRESRKTNKKWVKVQQAKRESFHGMLNLVYTSAKTRSSSKGMDFEITMEDMHALYIKQNGRCAVTDVYMELKSGDRAHYNMFKLSLDRIDSKKGYTVDNIQLVCTAVNLAKTNHSDVEFKFWIDAIYKGLHKLENQQPSP